MNLLVVAESSLAAIIKVLQVIISSKIRWLSLGGARDSQPLIKVLQVSNFDEGCLQMPHFLKWSFWGHSVRPIHRALMTSINNYVFFFRISTSALSRTIFTHRFYYFEVSLISLYKLFILNIFYSLQFLLMLQKSCLFLKAEFLRISKTMTLTKKHNLTSLLFCK